MRAFSRALLLVSVSLLAACGGAQGPTSNAKQDAVIAMAGKEGSLLRLAGATRAGGDLQTAAQLYEQAIAVSKDNNVAAHLALADLYTEIGKAQMAVGVLREAEKLQPENPGVLRALGNALVSVGEPMQAVDVFSRAITADPADPRFYNGKGVALDMTGDYTAAQAAYHQGLDADGRDEDSYIKNNLALSYLMNDQFNDAIELLQPLLLQPGVSPTIRQNLALAYGLKGDREHALKLGLKDLSKEQAEENLAFYEMYLKSRKPLPLKQSEAAPAAPVIAEKPVEKKPVVAAAPIKKVEPIVKAETKAPAAAKPVAAAPAKVETASPEKKAEAVKAEVKEAPAAKPAAETASEAEKTKAVKEEKAAVTAKPDPEKKEPAAQPIQPVKEETPAKPKAGAPEASIDAGKAADEAAAEAATEAEEEISDIPLPEAFDHSEPTAGKPATAPSNEIPTRKGRYRDEWLDN